MPRFESINPDFPFAHKALERSIRNESRKPFGILNHQLINCGFAAFDHEHGDTLYRHNMTGEVLRLTYICRDLRQIEES